jgi:acid phosphatase type 7
MHRGTPPAVRLAIVTLLAGVGALLVVLGLVTLLRAAGLGAASTPGESGGPVAASLPAAPGTVAPAPTGSSAATTPGSPTPIPAEVILVGAGDIGRCDGTTDEDTAALVEGRAGIVFTLGDNAYEHGSADDFRDCFGPSWGRLKDRIELPVPGNHEYETRDAAGYREYFGDRAVRDGATWYSVDLGSWHVVVPDPTCAHVQGGCGPDSPQLAWLRDDLAASDARCTLALFHHPRFSSGEHGSDGDVAPFWDELYAAGADLVLNGHEHDYERFAAQDPRGNADDERGIMQLIVGTGGAELREFKDPVPNSQLRSSLAYGVLELRLTQAGWRWEFHSTDNSFSDAGAGHCH